MFSFFRKKKENKIFEASVSNFSEEKLCKILNIVKSKEEHFNVYEGLSSEEIQLKEEIISQKLFVKIPSDYKFLLQQTNGFYFDDGIKFLNIDELLKETSNFKDMMEDWEIGKITNPFLEIVRYHDGDGFVFWYSELNKYVVVDYVSDYELDDIGSLKTFDNICEVIDYLKIID